MAVNLGSAYGKVTLDVKGLLTGVASAKSGINSLVETGAKLRSLGIALTLGVSLPILAVGKNALMAASAMTETKNKVKVVFKEMSESVLEWSKNSATAFGQSQQQALSAAGTFGALFVTMDIGTEKAAEMSMKLVELASDLASFYDLDPGVALEKLRSGLVGESEPLRTVGIRISEVEVQAKALQMGLVDVEVDMVAVNGATLDLRSAQQELADAMRGGGVDTDKLSSAQNRLANASDRVSDAQGRVAKAQLGVQRAQRDLNALLADPKVEADSLRVVHARERVADAEQRVADAQDSVGDASRGAAEAQNSLNNARTPAAADALDIAQAEQKVAEAQQAIGTAMSGTNVELTEGQKLLARYEVIMEQSAVAHGDFSRTAMDFANSLRTLQATWGDTLVVIGDFFLPIATKVVHILTQMLEKFNNLAPWQQKIIVGFFTLAAVIGPLLFLFGFLLPMLANTTKSMNPLSGGIFGLVFSFVKLLAVLAIVVKVLAFLGISTGPVGAGILGLNTAIVGVGGSILAALAPVLFILLAIAAVIVWWALAWKLNLFYIRDTVASTVKIIKALWGAFTAFLRGDTEEAMEYLQAAFDAFGEHVNLIFMKVFGIKDAWAKFFDFMRDALGKTVAFIVKTFTNMDWSLVGKSILSGIANGMLLGLPALIITAGRVATSVLAEIKKSLGISSPSKEAMKLGAFTAQGFMLGMQTMNPDDIARSLIRPITNNSNSQSQTIINNFSSGLTTRQAQSMIAENNEQLINMMISGLGGA